MATVKYYLFHKTSERMDGRNFPVKKSHYIKKWMALANPPEEASRVKKLMASSYSSLQIKQHTTL